MFKKIKRFVEAIKIVQRLGSRNIIELERRAYHDSLTGVYNRWYFEEVTKKEIEKVRRYGGLFSIVIVDVDDFKKINDKFGHGVGDEVLRNLANLFGRICRKSDIVVRWGGDEFLIFLPETEKRGAEEVINKLKKLTQQFLLPINLSCGITSWKGLSLEEMIYEADLMMYADKTNKKKKE